MGRAKTPSFICELPLRVTPADERHLLVRLDCARQVYNACLGESLKRLARMRPSPDYQAARAMPKGPKKSPAAVARTAAFRAVNEQFGFQEFDLHAYASQFSQSWLGEHLDSNTVQKVATRAFLATQQYAFGKRGKPRFKGKGWFDSVEGKTNTSGLLWRENTLKWSGLELPALIDPQDTVTAHGLASRVKFVRLVRRKLNGRNRFYVQLVCEGKPHRKKDKHPIGQGVVGLDIGPSTIAVVSEQSATLERFCDELKPQQKAIRKLQRQMDRQRRANNPDNFNADGTATRASPGTGAGKPGARQWHNSKRYISTRTQLAELHRQQAAYRKSLHGRLVNRVLAQGNVIKLEKLSYRAFQKRFGKSVAFRAPGAFVAQLRRKAANAGGQTDEFPTAPTRLSQVCLCGTIAKKPLSLRWHICECGVGPVQRDLFSAWLACFVNDKRLDAGQAQAAWPGVDTRLRMASSAIQPTIGQGQPKPTLRLETGAGQSRSSAQSGEHFDKAPVFGRESISQPEPPGFSRGEYSGSTTTISSASLSSLKSA
jgi:transposase